MTKVFYIDPQSYNNLSLYDFSLLSPMRGQERLQATYYHSDMYQLSELPLDRNRPVFCYNHKSNALTKALSYCSSMLRIARDIAFERPDVVHVQWTRLWAVDCAFALFAKMCGCKMVYTAHNILPHHPKRFDKAKCRAYYRLMSETIVHTQRTADELKALCRIENQRVSVIHHGVLQTAVDQEAVLTRKEQLLSSLGIKPTDVVFSCLGYQYKYKGVEMLADVWSNAGFSQIPDAHLLLVGKNRDVPPAVFQRMKGLKNVVVLDEQVDDIDFEAYLQISSVALLPYITISQSGLLFTALCSGVPVAVTDVGGLAEPLKYAKVGWCMGQPTADNLKAMLQYLVDHRDEIEQVRADKTAFAEIIGKYSWTNISATTRQLYHRLAGQNEKSPPPRHTAGLPTRNFTPRKLPDGRKTIGGEVNQRWNCPTVTAVCSIKGGTA